MSVASGACIGPSFRQIVWSGRRPGRDEVAVVRVSHVFSLCSFVYLRIVLFVFFSVVFARHLVGELSALVYYLRRVAVVVISWWC